ncbi:hypothetical protein V6Z11_D10G057500 [Gossypium hirsutum]
MGRGLLQLLWLFQVLKCLEGCFGSLIRLVTEIMPLELRLKFGIGFYGRVHITEVNDNNVLEKPFGNFKVGQTITARIVGKPNQKGLKFVQHLSGLKFALLFLLYFFTSWYVLVLLL